MQAIKKYLFAALLITTLSCDTDDDRRFENDKGRFVRFFLQLDRNNEPIAYPEIDLRAEAVSNFEKENLSTLKIPVALTSTPLEESISVDFTTMMSGLNNVEIRPNGRLTFEGTQLVDTIFVEINERWNPTNQPQIVFELTAVSDEDIQLGIPNDIAPNKTLQINFNDLELTYGISSPNRVDLTGTQGEEQEIIISFPQGYIASEVQGQNLLIETQSNFNYTLSQQPLTNQREVRYNFTVDQAFTDDDLLYKTSFALANLNGYTLDGAPGVSLLRDPVTPRDVAANTAANFYDTSNPFYRIYGVNWMDFDTDGVCEWRDFNTFTVPVIVDENDPNAILGDDNGTADPSDDVYYHAFRIGFEPPTTNTTNPFNFRRWFTNESTSTVNSPGLNIVPALEFYPDNGNSTTSGSVQVIEQTIQIGTTATNGSVREFITISGSGVYSEIAPGTFEIVLELNATNNRLFGGTRTAKYHFYNTNNFVDPALLNESCFVPIAL